MNPAGAARADPAQKGVFMSMSCFSSTRRVVVRGCAALMLGAAGAAAWAQDPAVAAEQPRAAQTLKKPATDGKVLGGVQRGTDAAGRGIDRAGDAALGGVNRASESASRPIRRAGDWLGGKLERGPGGGRARTDAAAGPQGNGP